MEKVFAVVVTFNGLRWLDRCIGSLLSSEMPVSVIVVDNASTDGTPERIAADFPDVHLIRSDVNYGFAKANNIGIRFAYDSGADYVFLLNQDAWVEKNTVPVLVECAVRHAEAGIVSPIHMNGEGTALDWGFSGHVPVEFVSDSFMSNLADCYQCDFINAAAWLIKRSCLEKVGGFDTSLFVHYGEDSNWCHRLKYHGLKLMISTHCYVFHDREIRKGQEAEYRQSVFSQDGLTRRLEFADIRHDIDINGFIKSANRSMYKSYFKLRFAQAAKLKKEVEFFTKVKTSREINKNGGLCWL